jgi:hypothetical protein
MVPTGSISTCSNNDSNSDSDDVRRPVLEWTTRDGGVDLAAAAESFAHQSEDFVTVCYDTMTSTATTATVAAATSPVEALITTAPSDGNIPSPSPTSTSSSTVTAPEVLPVPSLRETSVEGGIDLSQSYSNQLNDFIQEKLQVLTTMPQEGSNFELWRKLIYMNHLTFAQTCLTTGSKSTVDEKLFSTLKDSIETMHILCIPPQELLPTRGLMMDSPRTGNASSSQSTGEYHPNDQLPVPPSSSSSQPTSLLPFQHKDADVMVTVINEDECWLYPHKNVRRKVYKVVSTANGTRKECYETVPLQHPDARYVAISKVPFRMEKKRLVYKFYELASDRTTIVGLPMVAKGSPHAMKSKNGKTEHTAWTQEYIQRHQFAHHLAVQFNNILQAHPNIHAGTPKISFLDCSLYTIKDVNIGKMSVVVESYIDQVNWRCWSPESMHQHDSMNSRSDVGLFTPKQVAHAFSHFSFILSNRRWLISELQGVYDEKKRVIIFSNPGILYRNHLQQRYNKNQQDDRWKGNDSYNPLFHLVIRHARMH